MGVSVLSDSILVYLCGLLCKVGESDVSVVSGSMGVSVCCLVIYWCICVCVSFFKFFILCVFSHYASNPNPFLSHPKIKQK